MSQENFFEAAKEGNSQAIAALLNKSLNPKGVTIKVANNKGCLTIVAESQAAPKQDALVDFLKNSFAKIVPANISQVIVRGRAVGQTQSAWQESFNLNSSQSISEQIGTFSSENSTDTRSQPIKLISSNNTLRIGGSQSLKFFGWLLFTIGSVMLLAGLAYDPTVSSGTLDVERTYNIGEISNKSTYTNTGGFLAVCGAIFITRPRDSSGSNRV